MMPFTGRSSGNPDQYVSYGKGLIIGSFLDNQIYYTRGRPLVNRLDLAPNNLTLVFFGQSNLSSVNPTVYTPGNTVYNFSAVDGAIYTTSAPLIGTSTGGSAGLGHGCTAVRIADSLVINGNAGSVVVADSAIGGTLISPTWDSDANNIIRPMFMGPLTSWNDGIPPSR
jgi:hypothetical protein